MHLPAVSEAEVCMFHVIKLQFKRILYCNHTEFLH